jgi:hypothetical protein
MVGDRDESLAVEGGVSTAGLVTDQPVMVLGFSALVVLLSRVGALPFALARIAAGTQRPPWWARMAAAEAIKDHTNPVRYPGGNILVALKYTQCR